METGLFVFLLAFSFGFTFWAWMRQASIFSSILRIVAISVFFGLALYIGSGEEISTTATQTTNIYTPTGWENGTTTTKTVLLAQGSASWMSWVFMGFAILNMVLVIKEAFEK